MEESEVIMGKASNRKWQRRGPGWEPKKGTPLPPMEYKPYMPIRDTHSRVRECQRRVRQGLAGRG